MRLDDGVQTNFPELGRLSAKQPMGTTLVDGPRRRTMETLPAVVGFQVIVNGVPAGTIWPRPGAAMGFPLGVSPTGA